MIDNSEQINIEKLLEFALEIGATKAVRLLPEQILVENRLAGFCREPKCPNFGLSMSCPPHVSGPNGFRKWIEKSRHALVFRIEVDAASLTGDDRPVVFRLLHEVVAGVEIEAIRMRFTNAQGFAGGSCKQSFCHDHEHCQVLDSKGNCRFPDLARPSMSGFGVNVGELMKSAGWTADLFPQPTKGSPEPLSWIAGLILLR